MLERFRSDFGKRATGLVVALALELLLLLALLSLSRSVTPPEEPLLTEVDLSATDYAEPPTETPEPEPSQAPVDQSAPQPTEATASALQPASAPPALIPIPEAPPAPVAEERPRPARPAAVLGPVQGPPNRGSSSATGDSVRVGTAPNGEPLYAARWYREPYDDELRGYLSTATGPGWGLIACRTVEDYRVEDCVPIAESPAGSMINRAVLAAAWQFKVRPPRLGGRVLVGSWVRIRIDYTVLRE